MLLRGSKLDLLPRTQPSSSSLLPSSLLFEPSTQSLALMLSDSSFLLYPSLSPFSYPSSSPSPTSIPPVSTSAAFLRLLPTRNSNALRVLFLSTSPSSAGATIILRAWILLRRPGVFAPASLNFKQEVGRSALALDLSHGFSVQLAGSVNVFVLHSLAANQIWVLAARLAGDEDGDDDRLSVSLAKCAVIDCMLPIYSIHVSMGFLILGEVDGVRVFPLKPLVKGSDVRRKGLRHSRKKTAQGVATEVASCKKSILNGLILVRLAKPSGPAVGCCNCKGHGVEGGRRSSILIFSLLSVQKEGEN